MYLFNNDNKTKPTICRSLRLIKQRYVSCWVTCKCQLDYYNGANFIRVASIPMNQNGAKSRPNMKTKA